MLYKERLRIPIWGKRFKSSYFTSKQNEHQKVICEILGKKKRMASGLLYKEYCKLVKNFLVDRAYGNYMRRMGELGLIKIEGKGRWKIHEIIV